MDVIRKRGNTWYVDFMYQGRRYRQAIGPYKTEAKILPGKIEAQIKDNKFFDIEETANIILSEIVQDFWE